MGNDATAGKTVLREKILAVLSAHFKKSVGGDDVFGDTLPLDEQDAAEIRFELENELNMDLPDFPENLSGKTVNSIVHLVEKTEAKKLPINTF